jgi:hypothetical protein
VHFHLSFISTYSYVAPIHRICSYGLQNICAKLTVLALRHIFESHSASLKCAIFLSHTRLHSNAPYSIKITIHPVYCTFKCTEDTTGVNCLCTGFGYSNPSLRCRWKNGKNGMKEVAHKNIDYINLRRQG